MTKAVPKKSIRIQNPVNQLDSSNFEVCQNIKPYRFERVKYSVMKGLIIPSRNL